MSASATRTVCAVDDLHVDVLDSLDELRSVKQDWESVYDADPEAQYFLTWTRRSIMALVLAWFLSAVA